MNSSSGGMNQNQNYDQDLGGAGGSPAMINVPSYIR